MIAGLLLATLLPARLDPPQPFPAILTDAPEFSALAPGVEYGQYDLYTREGPIVVHALAVAPHAPNISLDSVLSADALTSNGETLSSMAHRTNAIGGINGDYFDIGNTNRPTNIVVHDGALIRTPRKRYALLVTSDGSAHIAEDAFHGNVTLGTHAVVLDAVNTLPPPDGGTAIVTPVFGNVPPQENLTLVHLVPTDGTPPFCTYRVTGIADSSQSSPAGYYLAIGINAYASTGVPDAGDTIAVNGDLAPFPLASVVAAVGGGPLLLDGGMPADDPDGPNGGEFAQRIPESGAAIAPDGTLFLLEVDGREPDRSVGVTRPEFTSLMRAVGAVRGMAFDGGGSSEMVARTATQTEAIVQGAPSDGRERRIADGLFIYDAAPPEPASQVLAAPSQIHAMPGARVPLRVAFGDRDDRVVSDDAAVELQVEPASLGTIDDGAFVASHAGSGAIVIRSGTFVREIPVEVDDDPARVAILPHDPSAPRGGSVDLRARAFDSAGYELALPAALPWRALNGTIDARGVLAAGGSNALVSLLLGDHLSNVTVVVGFHDVPLATDRARAMTVPRGAEAGVTERAPCDACTSLTYALGTDERAAYLILEQPLPSHSVAIAFDLYDNGGGGLLKVALRNAIDEEVLLPAGTLDRDGWRSVEIRLPSELAQPARLTALYVIGAHAGMQMRGTFAIRNLHAIAAGTADTRP